jgi:hypothetical protein
MDSLRSAQVVELAFENPFGLLPDQVGALGSKNFDQGLVELIADGNSTVRKRRSHEGCGRFALGEQLGRNLIRDVGGVLEVLLKGVGSPGERMANGFFLFGSDTENFGNRLGEVARGVDGVEFTVLRLEAG